MYLTLSTLSLKMVVPQQIEISNLSFWFSISLVCYIGDSSKWSPLLWKVLNEDDGISVLTEMLCSLSLL